MTNFFSFCILAKKNSSSPKQDPRKKKINFSIYLYILNIYVLPLAKKKKRHLTKIRLSLPLKDKNLQQASKCKRRWRNKKESMWKKKWNGVPVTAPLCIVLFNTLTYFACIFLVLVRWHNTAHALQKLQCMCSLGMRILSAFSSFPKLRNVELNTNKSIFKRGNVYANWVGIFCQ